MPSPLVLVVFVAASDANDASTDAMARATRDALGADASVSVRPLTSEMSDDDALAAAAPLHPDVVAEVAWTDAEHLHARLHVHLEGATRWVDRQLVFETVDAPAERGRTLGFAIVSMLPEHERPGASNAPPPTTPTAPAPTTTAPAPPPPAATVAPVPTAEPRAPIGREVPAPPAPPGRSSLDVAAIASMGIGGYAGGIGASLAGRWTLVPRLWLRIGAGARAGDVAPAHASSLVFFGAAGVAWEAWAPVPELVLGLRADALVSRHQLSHFSSDDPAPVSEAQWTAGADALVEGAWTLSHNAALFAATGPEVAFGTSRIFVRGVEIAEVPPLRLVAEIGARARF